MSQERDPMKESHAVAQLGVFRRPLIYLASIATGLALHWAWPRPLMRWTSASPGRCPGRGVLPAVWLLGAAVPRCRHAGARSKAAHGDRADRHPIYVAFSLLQLGIAIWVGSWWLVATLAAAIAIIHYVVVPKEERYLEARFGAEYRGCKASVRRWF